MTALTRAFEDNPPAISEEAFHQLADHFPQDVANVIYELASAGDVASCEAAVNSGIAREVSSASLAFAMLPLKEKHPAAEPIVASWMKQAGGEGKAGEALLQTREPAQAARLIQMGAKLDVENSNQQNALLFAISQQNTEMVRSILHACNQTGVQPIASKEQTIFDLLLRRSMSDAALTLIFDAFPAIGDMKPAFQVFAGTALVDLACENSSWSAAEEKPAPLSDKTREIARRLMEFAQLENSRLWNHLFGYYAIFSSEDFLENPDQQMAIFQNVLANGLDINHVFDDVITTGFDSAGVRKLVKGTFLHFAASQNNAELLTANLQAGADVGLKAGGRTLAQFLAKSERARDALEAWETKRDAELESKRQAIADILYRADGAPAAARAPETEQVNEVQDREVAPAVGEEAAPALAVADSSPADEPEVAAASAAEVAVEQSAQEAAESVAETLPAAEPDPVQPAVEPAMAEPIAEEAPVEVPTEPAIVQAAEIPAAATEAAAPPAPASAAATPAAPSGDKKGFGFKRK